MERYEYNIVPAPTKGQRAKGVKGTDARFAHTLSELMNELGKDGWEYLCADTLPCEERSGFTKRSTVYKTLLVFRRPMADKHADAYPSHASDTPRLEAPKPDPEPEPEAPKLGGASRESARGGGSFFGAANVSTDMPAEEPTVEETPALETPDPSSDDELLTKRGHSFATYSPRTRLPGVRTRD